MIVSQHETYRKFLFEILEYEQFKYLILFLMKILQSLIAGNHVCFFFFPFKIIQHRIKSNVH